MARHLVPVLPDRDIAPDVPPNQLIGVFIGLDTYENLPPLHFAVNDARSMRRTLEDAHQGGLTLRVLTAGEIPRKDERYPSKAALLEALSDAAREARAPDTVLVFYAGHGCLIDGTIHLVPANGRSDRVASLLSLRELQEVFRECESSHRLLFLDCCQARGAAPGSSGTDPPERALPAGPSVQWRSGMPLSQGCIDALEDQLRGWTVLTACSPGEVSYETRRDPLERHLAEDHGLFTYFLARGLQGEADLDQDGIVSYGELVQYVSRALPQRVKSVTGGTDIQNPTVIWRGIGWLPLTRVRPPRRRRPGAGFLRRWRQSIFGPWPYRDVSAGRFLRFGFGTLYGVVVFLEVLILGAPAIAARWWSLAVLCGLASVLVWLAVSGFSIAANEHRWHRGGYLGNVSFVLWNLLLLVTTIHLPGAGESEVALYYGVDLVLVMGLTGILGFNCLHLILALATLLSEGKDHILRRILVDLNAKLMDVRMPNAIPVVSAHPRVYIRLFGLYVNLFILGHSLNVLMSPDPIVSALKLTRNAVLITLILWQVFGFEAAYKQIERKYSRQI
ncbi:MAG: caspase family protein [bacterium]|nr:caspase family protein [bacterium]